MKFILHWQGDEIEYQEKAKFEYFFRCQRNPIACESAADIKEKELGNKR